MSDFVITCGSTADLSPERMEALGVSYISYTFELGGMTYSDTMGGSISPSEFYARMAAGELTHTSQVTIGEYLDFFRPILDSGKDILHLTFSGGLSGTTNSANIAAAELSAEYPERRLYIVDSLAASSGYGLLIDRLCELRDLGYDIEKLRDWALENRLRVHHWFFSTDLTFYIRGGRIKRAAGLVGKALNICPLININNTGHLIPREKLRGKKKAFRRVLELMTEHAEGGAGYSGKCFISNAACPEDAGIMASMIEEAFPQLNGRVEIFPIGPTIGSHTGPDTLAIFFFGDERTE